MNGHIIVQKKKELPDTIPSKKKKYAFAFVHQHGRRYVN